MQPGDCSLLPEDEIVERFAGVTVWKQGGERAPHKPLLLLWTLARVQRGGDGSSGSPSWSRASAASSGTSALPGRRTPSTRSGTFRATACG